MGLHMPQHMVSLIINADDYGMSPAVTAGIAELLVMDCVSSATVMMCTPGSLDVQREYRDRVCTTRLGVHLQLTNGRPVLSNPNTGHTNSESGLFRGKNDFALAQPDQVYKEWRAQIELFVSLYGHRPSHIDSHHGPHQEPKLLPVYVALAKEYGIAARPSGRATARLLAAAGILHADVVIDGWTGRQKTVSELIEMVSNAANEPAVNMIEVITHPGFVDDELRSVSSLTEARVSELAELRKLTTGLLERAGLSLAAYTPPIK
jgi:predicted glycoside hydrolase/deacetylase ChbG (UPF0249 family)